MRPALYVLAGVNGAGKSSIGGKALQRAGIDWFNPDTFTRELVEATARPLADANAAAWQEGVRRLDAAIANGEDYAFETTLGGNTIAAKLREHMWIEELIEIAESEASCELYGILKRPDEKYVTERAYDNPKFVEDLVRDVALTLNDEPCVLACTVEAENFESIHNHSAFARIVQPSSQAGPRHRQGGDGRRRRLLPAKAAA